jgi:hypothetical protein
MSDLITTFLAAFITLPAELRVKIQLIAKHWNHNTTQEAWQHSRSFQNFIFDMKPANLLGVLIVKKQLWAEFMYAHNPSSRRMPTVFPSCQTCLVKAVLQTSDT